MGQEAARIVEVVRTHGTEATLAAEASTTRVGGVEGAIHRVGSMFAKLVHILENKHLLRRGHVVSLLCTAEDVPDEEGKARGNQP